MSSKRRLRARLIPAALVLGAASAAQSDLLAQETITPRERYVLPDAMDDPARIQVDPLGRPRYSDAELRDLGRALMIRARTIADPAERCLALDRAARTKISANKVEETRLAYEDARIALLEAGSAALQVPDKLIHDQRIAEVILTSVSLAEEQSRQAIMDLSPGDPREANSAGGQGDRDFWLGRARETWLNAANLGAQTYNPAFRSQALFQVASAQANSSLEIALAAARTGSSRADLAGLEADFFSQADVELTSAQAIAMRIARPVWRDRTLVAIADSASTSHQFARGIEIAKTVPQPEYRSDAFVRIAESQARFAYTIRTDVASDVRALAASWDLLTDDLKRRAAERAEPKDINDLLISAESVLKSVDDHWALVNSTSNRAQSFSARQQVDRAVTAASRSAEIDLADRLTENAAALASAAEQIRKPFADVRDRVSDGVKQLEKLNDDFGGETNPEKKAEILRQAKEVYARTIPSDEDTRNFAELRDRSMEMGRSVRAIANEMEQYSTRSYAKAATTVASIPVEAPRAILAGVLIDSLITVGRFEDARRSAILYPDTEHRLRVLGAVAESMGDRRLVDSAREWIAREVPPEHQARILRRLGDGVIDALDKARNKTMSGPDRSEAIPDRTR